MSEIKAIETSYKGYRFRSRLEARWAIFFEKSRIAFEYEYQGFELNAGKYLPDFWLPQVSMYAEVKPISFSDQELTLAAELFLATNFPVLLLVGSPDAVEYPAIDRAEFNHGAWDFGTSYYDLQEGHQYWLDEGRFYWSDSGPEFEGVGGYKKWRVQVVPDFERREILDGWSNELAIKAARSARFEFGEQG